MMTKGTLRAAGWIGAGALALLLGLGSGVAGAVDATRKGRGR
jgi:hypothetical protein